MKYFKVMAKCGHVGKNNYYEEVLYLWAEDKKSAAKIARNFPRVKHDQKYAILAVEEISFSEYLSGKEEIKKSPYWICNNIQDQRRFFPELTNQIQREDNKQKKLDKKHSLRKNYNANDPLYYEYSRYSGDILSEMLG